MPQAHLGRLAAVAAEVDEADVDDVRTVADCQSLVLQSPRTAHGDDLPHLLVLWGQTRGPRGQMGSHRDPVQVKTIHINLKGETPADEEHYLQAIRLIGRTKNGARQVRQSQMDQTDTNGPAGVDRGF